MVMEDGQAKVAEAQRIVGALKIDPAATQRAIDALKIDPATTQRAVDALKIDPAAVRRAIDALKIDMVSAQRAVDSLKIDPAAIRLSADAFKRIEEGVSEQLNLAFNWKTTALAMPGAQLVDLTRQAAVSAPVVANTLTEFEEVLEREQGEQSNAIFEWLTDMAPVARNRVLLGTLNALTAILAQFYSEVGIQPPFHVLSILLVLLAIADVWALLDEGK